MPAAYDAAHLAQLANISGRLLYRFTLCAARNSTKIRTCDQWHRSQTEADKAASEVAIEWGTTRPMKVVSVKIVTA